jgi:hypothetical protein
MKTVLPALAQAVVIHKSLPSDQPAGLAINGLKAKLQEASAAMVEAYNFCPNLVAYRPSVCYSFAMWSMSCCSLAIGTLVQPS